MGDSSIDLTHNFQLTISSIIQDLVNATLLNTAYRSVIQERAPALQDQVDALLASDRYAVAKIQCNDARASAVRAVADRDIPAIVGAIGEAQGIANQANNQQIENPRNPK